MEIDKEMARKLESLEELYRIYMKELRCCREGYMVRSKSRKGTIYYKSCINEDGVKVCRGISKDKKAIYAYSRKRFLLEMVEVLNRNISALRTLVDTY